MIPSAFTQQAEHLLDSLLSAADDGLGPFPAQRVLDDQQRQAGNAE